MKNANSPRRRLLHIRRSKIYVLVKKTHSRELMIFSLQHTALSMDRIKASLTFKWNSQYLSFLIVWLFLRNTRNQEILLGMIIMINLMVVIITIRIHQPTRTQQQRRRQKLRKPRKLSHQKKPKLNLHKLHQLSLVKLLLLLLIQIRHLIRSKELTLIKMDQP